MTTLGAHAQRGLQYLVCVSVCVCVCVSVCLSVCLSVMSVITILLLRATQRLKKGTDGFSSISGKHLKKPFSLKLLSSEVMASYVHTLAMTGSFTAIIYT